MKRYLLLLLLPGLLFAQQDTENPTPTPPTEFDQQVETLVEAMEQQATENPDDVDTSSFMTREDEVASLRALNDSILRREQEREEIYQQMQAAVDPIQREKLVPELERINRELTTLNRRFQSIAVSTDISIFEGEAKKEFDLKKELEQLAQPLLAEMKKATKESRELGELNAQLELNEQRLATSKNALNNLEPLLEGATDPELIERLKTLQERWQGRLEDAENQITVVEHQLKQREQAKVSPIEQARGMASGFVRTRGLNLLLGVLAFVGVFMGMRWAQRAWSRIRPSRKKGRSFSSRLTSLIWAILSILLALGATLATFNATGDWFLLSLTILFLLGVGWAAMKTLPGMIEQFRMMLNMGSVREDERLIYDGLPWKVNAISFRTELLNPELNGGVLTLPTHMLVGMLSRPPGPDEEWFPSRKGDWVLLSDGTYGKVSYQTPSTVQIVPPGGSQKIYNTLQYMDLSPTVMSTGFRRQIEFGIDYRHIAEATTEIPAAMKTHLEEVLTERLGEELQHIEVQLAEASDSSLTLCVIVDCKGGAASDWPYLPMWVQTALVDLCNRKQWSIPFPQLQIHTDKA